MFKKTILAALLIASTSATAGIITQNDSMEYELTGFQNQEMSFEKFNDEDGRYSLDSVTMTLSGEILGLARMESQSGQASLIDVTLAALLSLTTSNGQELIATLPEVSNDFNATAYDGVFDFDGTSGTTYFDMYAFHSETVTFFDTETIDLFKGLGLMNTFLSSNARSSVSGGGNLTSAFNSDARGILDITYSFTDTTATVAVPEPTSIAILGLSLMGLALTKRKKSS
jgi:hypothetical protein